jgi:hypothetical protein
MVPIYDSLDSAPLDVQEAIRKVKATLPVKVVGPGGPQLSVERVSKAGLAMVEEEAAARDDVHLVRSDKTE